MKHGIARCSRVRCRESHLLDGLREDVPLDVHARLDADRTVEPSAVPAPVRPAGSPAPPQRALHRRRPEDGRTPRPSCRLPAHLKDGQPDLRERADKSLRPSAKGLRQAFHLRRSVMAAPRRIPCDAFDRQARVRHLAEQNTADRRSSSPIDHSWPHTGHTALSPRCMAATRRRVCCKARHRLDLHLLEQSTAAAYFVGGSRTPHSRQYRRTTPPNAIAPM